MTPHQEGYAQAKAEALQIVLKAMDRYANAGTPIGKIQLDTVRELKDQIRAMKGDSNG